jgi:two-component system phosphate regulon sensor histidine kinase PhoR
MEWLIVALAVALAGSLWWIARLRRGSAVSEAALPAPDPIEPLFDAATSAIDVGLLILDEERRVRYLNPQAAGLIGLGDVPQIGQGLITVLRDYQVDSLTAEVMRDGEPRELVLQAGTAGRTLRLRATRFEQNGVAGAVLVVRDVTQLSMLERARRDMVANVSHELRTPLASVKLLVETLQTEPPAPIASRMLSQMAEEIDAITQLVNELHELSQIESGRVALQLTPAPLAPVVLRALERIRPQAERKGILLAAGVSEALPAALIDADRIGQVLLNLLHNAAKFTPDQGRISIQATAITVAPGPRAGPPADAPVPEGHTPGEWLLVSVSDSGLGIPGHDLPRIFERFYKVDRARTRNAGGTGLGLAIAKHLVEGHGGRIWAASREGQGSTFYFTLPVA